VRLDHLDVEQLERCYAQMIAGTYRPHATALSTNTVRRVAAVVRASLADVARPSARWVRVDQYDGARVIGPKPRRRSDEAYDLADIAKVIDAGDVEVAELVQLALATGARQGELAAIRWRDVDLVTGVLTIEGSVTVLPTHRR